MIPVRMEASLRDFEMFLQRGAPLLEERPAAPEKVLETVQIDFRARTVKITDHSSGRIRKI